MLSQRMLVAVLAACSLPSVGPAQAPATETEKLPPELRLVPRDAVYFGTIRLADTWKSEFLLPLRLVIQVQAGKPLQEFEKSLGLKLADIERLSAVVLNADENDPAWAVVATSAQPYDRARVLATLAPEAQEANHEGRGYYPTTTPPDCVLHLLNDRTIVLGPRDHVHALLERAAAPAESGPLAEAVALASQGHHLVGGFDFARIRRRVPANLPPEAHLFLPLLAMNHGSLAVDLKETAQAQVRLHFPNEYQARAGETAVRDLLELTPRALKQGVLDSLGPAKGSSQVQKQLKQVEAWFAGIPVRREDATVVLTPQMKKDELAVAVAVLLPVVQKLRKAAE